MSANGFFAAVTFLTKIVILTWEIDITGNL
jgi:hypothetical protein